MFDRRMFQAQMVLKGMNAKEVSSQMGINESTLYRKMSNEGDFSRKEIDKLISILDIEDPMAIFFAESLA